MTLSLLVDLSLSEMLNSVGQILTHKNIAKNWGNRQKVLTAGAHT